MKTKFTFIIVVFLFSVFLVSAQNEINDGRGKNNPPNGLIQKDTVKTSPIINSDSDQDFPTKDVVVADDQIVTGSIGVGFDCVDGEVFGFNTILLKENNVRIRFEDSSVGLFPANDWTLIANATESGGANYFAIEDGTAGIIPFKLIAGAPADALYVADNGNVGLGTSSPTQKLDVDGGMKLKAILTAPETPTEGVLYMDGVDHLLKFHNGTDWKTISGNQNLVAATLTGTFLEIDIENGASVSVDLQPLISDLENRITALEGLVGISKVETNKAAISQNVPNPFNAETSIPYFIPNEVNNANLVIYNVNGIEIKKYQIDERGYGNFIITSDNIDTGSYFYTLILNGKKLESKIMIRVD